VAAYIDIPFDTFKIESIHDRNAKMGALLMRPLPPELAYIVDRGIRRGGGVLFLDELVLKPDARVLLTAHVQRTSPSRDEPFRSQEHAATHVVRPHLGAGVLQL